MIEVQKAAEEYAEKRFEGYSPDFNDDVRAFLAGAAWQREQIEKLCPTRRHLDCPCSVCEILAETSDEHSIYERSLCIHGISCGNCPAAECTQNVCTHLAMWQNKDGSRECFDCGHTQQVDNCRHGVDTRIYCEACRRESTQDDHNG